MTLFKKADDGTYSILSDAEEKVARADANILISHGCIPTSGAAVDFVLAPAETISLKAEWAKNSTASAVAGVILGATSAIITSKDIASRCILSGVPLPKEWTVYYKALQAVVIDPTLSLPAAPAIPDGI